MLYGGFWSAESRVRGASGFPEKPRKILEMGDITELNTTLPATKPDLGSTFFPGGVYAYRRCAF
jgi:hypothetical protein